MHKFEIKTEYLSQLFGIIGTLVDEVRMEISKKGWNINCVDPAHVAMLDIDVGIEAFNSYQYKGKSLLIGIDVDKMKAILKLCKEHNITVFEGEVVAGKPKGEDEVHHDIIARLDYLKRLIVGVDCRAITHASIPKLNPGYVGEVEVDGLVFALKNAELLSDHLRLITDEDGMKITAKGEYDYVEMPLNPEGSKEPQESVFSMDYFSEFIKVIPTLTVKMEMGTDHPITITCDPVKGIVVKYLLAPRIKSD